MSTDQPAATFSRAAWKRDAPTILFLLLAAVVAGIVLMRPAREPGVIAPKVVQDANNAYLMGERDAKAGRRMTDGMLVDRGMNAADREIYRRSYDRTAYGNK